MATMGSQACRITAKGEKDISAKRRQREQMTSPTPPITATASAMP